MVVPFPAKLGLLIPNVRVCRSILIVFPFHHPNKNRHRYIIAPCE